MVPESLTHHDHVLSKIVAWFLEGEVEGIYEASEQITLTDVHVYFPMSSEVWNDHQWEERNSLRSCVTKLPLRVGMATRF